MRSYQDLPLHERLAVDPHLDKGVSVGLAECGPRQVVVAGRCANGLRKGRVLVRPDRARGRTRAPALGWRLRWFSDTCDAISTWRCCCRRPLVKMLMVWSPSPLAAMAVQIACARCLDSHCTSRLACAGFAAARSLISLSQMLLVSRTFLNCHCLDLTLRTPSLPADSAVPGDDSVVCESVWAAFSTLQWPGGATSKPSAAARQRPLAVPGPRQSRRDCPLEQTPAELPCTT